MNVQDVMSDPRDLHDGHNSERGGEAYARRELRDVARA
jgi:hypothetical protein